MGTTLWLTKEFVKPMYNFCLYDVRFIFRSEVLQKYYNRPFQELSSLMRKRKICEQKVVALSFETVNILETIYCV